MKGEVVISGLDIFDVETLLSTKNRKFQKLALDDLEQIVKKDNPLYGKIRKLILDYFNDYTRSVCRIIFGDIEDGRGSSISRDMEHK